MDGLILPYRTDWREMFGVLEYCKGKGAERSLLDARFGGGEGLRETLNALEQLRLSVRDEGSGDVRLTPLGDRLAYAPGPGERRAVLAEALLGYLPYRIPLERALDDGRDVLDAPWVEHIWQVDMRLAQPRNRVEEARTFFFRLADEAGLGTYRRGVRGQATRLEFDDDTRQGVRQALDAVAGQPGAGADNAAPAEMEQPHQEPSTIEAATGAGPRLEVSPPPDARTAHPANPDRGSPAMTIHVDLTEWDLEKIEAFLELIGYIPAHANREAG